MYKLIKNGSIVPDKWQRLTLAKGDTPLTIKLPAGPVLVPLSVWRARRAELVNREFEHGWPLGIWLSAEESAEDIGNDIDDFTVIAVEFDKYSDGKSYETARLLREHYGYRAELRAIGDVPRDKLSYQHQVGFDAFEFHSDHKHGNTLTRIYKLNAKSPSHKPFPAIA